MDCLNVPWVPAACPARMGGESVPPDPDQGLMSYLRWIKRFWSTGVRDYDAVVIKLRFRPVAVLATGLLLFTFVIGAVVTFAATDYDPNRDYITKYFSVFNPCILYDHYPSNVVSLIFASMYIFLFVIYIMILWTYQSLFGDPLLSFAAAILNTITMFGFFAFPNAFGSNLYEHGYKAAEEELSTADREIISLHSLWYEIFLIVSTILGAQVVHMVMRARGTLSWFQFLAAVIGIPAVGWFSLSFGMVCLRGLNPDVPVTALVLAVDWVTVKLRVGWYAWMPPFVLLFVPTPDMGVQVSVVLKRALGARSSLPGMTRYMLVRPERLLSWAFRVLAVELVGVYLATDPNDNSGTVLPLSSSFRAIPFRYVFTPVWIFMVLLIAISYGLTVARESLMRDDPRKTAAAGFLMLLSLVCSLVLIIPQVKNTIALYIVNVAALSIYILAVYADRDFAKMGPALLYVVMFIVMAALAGSTHRVVAIVFNLILAVMLCSLEWLLPEQPPLYWKLEMMGRTHNPDDDEDYTVVDEADDVPVGAEAIVRYAFEARERDELSVQRGDRVICQGEAEAGEAWVVVENQTGGVGAVPVAYLGIFTQGYSALKNQEKSKRDPSAHQSVMLDFDGIDDADVAPDAPAREDINPSSPPQPLAQPALAQPALAPVAATV